MSDPNSPPPARDVIDGIGDRTPNRPLWKPLLVAAIFIAWLGLLAGLYWWGSP